MPAATTPTSNTDKVAAIDSLHRAKVATVEPAASAEELAAIVAALAILAESEQPAFVPPRTSRWRAAARAFNDESNPFR